MPNKLTATGRWYIDECQQPIGETGDYTVTMSLVDPEGRILMSTADPDDAHYDGLKNMCARLNADHTETPQEDDDLPPVQWILDKLDELSKVEASATLGPWMTTGSRLVDATGKVEIACFTKDDAWEVEQKANRALTTGLRNHASPLLQGMRDMLASLARSEMACAESNIPINHEVRRYFRSLLQKQREAWAPFYRPSSYLVVVQGDHLPRVIEREFARLLHALKFVEEDHACSVPWSMVDSSGPAREGWELVTVRQQPGEPKFAYIYRRDRQ